MIKSIKLVHFKKYEGQTISLCPNGVTLLVGGNNSGKSTLIQALAIWEFCRIIIELEEGPEYLLESAANKLQGHGMNAEEFLPLALPTLNHLWTNLRPQAGQTKVHRGYTLQICCNWDDLDREQSLEFSMSLTNDRLFIKVTSSTLTSTAEKIPRIAYLPTFAGILPKENLVTPAERSAAIGRGMAGSVLRNMVYDLYRDHEKIKQEILGDSKKLSPKKKTELEGKSKWLKLQAILREIFLSELEVRSFNPRYQTVIHIDERKVKINEKGNYQLSLLSEYSRRDIMSQGSGYLQWLSIFSILYSGEFDVLVLDEPDAHMHATLQVKLLQKLIQHSEAKKMQILVATHSVEMIHESKLDALFSVENMKYFATEKERTALLCGIGSPHSQRVYAISKYHKIIFVEGPTDIEILKIFSQKAGKPIGSDYYIWETTKSHKTREGYLTIFNENNSSAVATSIRDRDTNHCNSIPQNLIRSGDPNSNIFRSLTWKRRHLECYLLYPPAIARAAETTEEEIVDYWRALGSYFDITKATFVSHMANPSLLECDVKKDILLPICDHFNITIYDIAKHMNVDEIPDDMITVIDQIRSMFEII